MRIQPTICKISFLLLLSAIFFSSCDNDNGTGVNIPNPKDTSALGRINHFIPTDDIERYKKDYMVQRDSLARANPDFFIPLTEAFNKQALLDLLKDPKNVGLKIYYGVKTGKRKELRLIIVGVDEQGNDLYLTQGKSAIAAQLPPGGGTKGGLEYGQCPPCEK
jgi:hypothetical protein